MTLREDLSTYGIEQGCPVHGDDYMRECGMCGCEYCRSCHTGPVCPECAAEEQESDLDDDADSTPDFEDVKHVKDLLVEDEEADRLTEDSGDVIPPEDLRDEGEEGDETVH